MVTGHVTYSHTEWVYADFYSSIMMIIIKISRNNRNSATEQKPRRQRRRWGKYNLKEFITNLLKGLSRSNNNLIRFSFLLLGNEPASTLMKSSSSPIWCSDIVYLHLPANNHRNTIIIAIHVIHLNATKEDHRVYIILILHVIVTPNLTELL